MLDIKNKILSQRSKTLDADDLVTLHHELMVVYGWIPLEEFKRLPIPTLWNLWYKVREELGKRENLRLCTLKYYGVKNPK